MSLAKSNNLVDTVDSNNRVIGASRRFELIENGLNFRTVHIIVIDEKRRIVLQKLPANHPRSPERLGSSVAGYLLEGETYDLAAHRKIKDELGFDADLTEIGDFRMIDVNSQKFVRVYKCTHEGAIDSFNRREISALRHRDVLWLEINTHLFPQKFTPTFLRVFRLYRTHEAQRSIGRDTP